MKITATDADEAGNNNSMIAYSIVNQDPADMFYIRNDGTICVKNPLDREVWTTSTHPQCYLSFYIIQCMLNIFPPSSVIYHLLLASRSVYADGQSSRLEWRTRGKLGNCNCHH